MIRLQNSCIGLTLGDNGLISSLRCISSRREFLLPNCLVSPFEIWTDFKKEYETDPLEPSDICETCFSAATAQMKSHSIDAQCVHLCYTQNDLLIQLSLKLSDDVLNMKLSIQNAGSREIRLLPVFPSLKGLDLDDEKGAQMLIMNQAGYVGPCWIHRGGFYGNTWVHSAQFGCMFDADTCLGFVIKDSAFGCKDISYQKPAFEIRWAPGTALKPGESITLPEVDLLIYQGSWYKTARAYGDWFRNVTCPDHVPDWVMKTSSYTGAWAVKREEGGEPDLLRNTMDTFDELPEQYLTSPIDVKEYAFFCELSSKLLNTNHSPCGSGKRLHTDGWNMIRKDMGGAESMRRGIEGVHKANRRLTLYIEGLITPPESDLYVHKPEAIHWLFMKPDGTSDGAYSDQCWHHMCPGSDWQDHLAEMSARLVRETDCDGLRLDCLGLHFKPCWNPAHHHDSPFDYNRWMLRLMEKVSAAVKAVKPNVLLSTEYPIDYFSIHFNHALFQPFEDLVWHSLKAPSPLYVALPHYRIDSWYGGAVSQAMQLLPMSTSICDSWYEVRQAVSSIFLDGTIMADPALSRTDAFCRHMRRGNEDLLLITRPDAPENPSWMLTDYHTSGELPLKTDHADICISMPLEYEPAEAFELSVCDGSIRSIPFVYDGSTLILHTCSVFSAILLRKDRGDALIACQVQINPEGILELHISSPALTNPLPARLHIDGLADQTDIPIMIPGNVQFPLPASILPGKYKAWIEGEGIATALKILNIGQ